MKKITLLIFSLLCFSLISPAFAEDSMKEIRQKFSLNQFNKKDLKAQKFKVESAFIFTVLQHTNELRIHQMGGATNNQVFITDKNG